MLISYSMPGITAASLTSGTWLTSDGGAALYDGKPARRARLQWAAGAALDGYVQIALSFATATPLRVLALLGTTLPAGVRVDFLGAGGDGLGGTCDNTRTFTMPDGTTAAWAVARDNEPAETGCWIRIYNDCNGATWAVNGTVVDLGEVWAGPAVDVPIDVGWSLVPVDPTEVELTRSSQPVIVRRSAYRQLSCAFSPLPSGAATVRGGGLANGMDWGKLDAALRGRARCVAIAQVRTPEAVAATALYGFASEIGETQQLRGRFFRKPMQFQEIPAR